MNKANVADRITKTRTGTGQNPSNGNNGIRRNGSNGRRSPGRNGERRVRSIPGTRQELEAAIQRYADLYEFAPVGYMTFDRAGRVEQANLAACELLGATRQFLVGSPFSLHVERTQLSIFLDHLVRCRAGERRVESNLRLKKRDGELLSVLLSSTPTSATAADGSYVYQTAIVDLTERERAEQTLREKEMELEVITTQTPFMLTRCTADLRYRYVSRAYAEMLGLTPDQIAGKPIVEMMGKQGLAAIRPYIDQVLSGKTVTYEALVPFEDRKAHFLHAVYVPDRTSTGEVVGWIASIIDITDRKRAELALVESIRQQSALYRLASRRQEAKSLHDIYRATLDAIIQGVRCNRASILLYDDRQMMRFVAWRGLSEKYRRAVEGHSPWKPTAKNPEPISIPDLDVADLPRELKATIKAEGIRAAAFIPLIAGEKLIGKFMTYYNAPHRFSADELKLSMTIAHQLAQAVEHMRAQTALQQSERRLRQLIQALPAAVYTTDAQGRITMFNDACIKISGRTPQIGKDLWCVSWKLRRPDGSRLPHEECPMALTLKENRPVRGDEIIVERPDGKQFHCVPYPTPLHDENGRLIGAINMLVDVTRLKKAETALQKSKKLLEQLVQQRTRALSVANAELENEIMRRKGLEGQILEISDREQERLGQELHDGLCQQLTAIGFLARATALRLRDHRVVQTDDLEKIAQLINSSVMDARNIARDLHKEEIEAAEFRQALEDLVSRKIWQTSCRLEVKTELNIEDDTVASQLYRILREAIINANKHAQATDIVLEVRRSNKTLIFSVKDNGVGFSPKAKTEKGLGFHIMRYRAESIGARLELESLKRGGTRVTVYLPDRN